MTQSLQNKYSENNDYYFPVMEMDIDKALSLVPLSLNTPEDAFDFIYRCFYCGLCDANQSSLTFDETSTRQVSYKSCN